MISLRLCSDNDPAVEEGAPSEFNSATAYLDGLNAPGQPGSSSSTGGDASDDLYSFDWPHSEQSNRCALKLPSKILKV